MQLKNLQLFVNIVTEQLQWLENNYSVRFTTDTIGY